MKFFHFTQNNSFGRFEDPAQSVVFEALDADHANFRAENFGLYFDGCANGVDCPCCGDRWSRQWSTDTGDDVPSVYGNPVVFDGVDNDVLVVYANGEKKFGGF